MAYKTTITKIAEELALGNKGLVITVNSDDEILGHLMAGKASVHWYEKNAKTKSHKTSWKELIAFMKSKPIVDLKRP